MCADQRWRRRVARSFARPAWILSVSVDVPVATRLLVATYTSRFAARMKADRLSLRIVPRAGRWEARLTAYVPALRLPEDGQYMSPGHVVVGCSFQPLVQRRNWKLPKGVKIVGHQVHPPPALQERHRLVSTAGIHPELKTTTKPMSW